MFSNMKWYDYILAFFTWGLWLLIVAKRNGKFKKAIIIIGSLFIVLGIVSVIYSKTDSGMAAGLEIALEENSLEKAKRILNENPSITTNSGMTAQEVVDTIKENIAKEKAIVAKKAKEQLIFAKSKGYSSYAEYQQAEEKRVAKEKADEIKRNTPISVPDLIADYNELYGKRVVVTGIANVTGNIGDALFVESGAMQFVNLDFSRLDKPTYKLLLKNCAQGCRNTIIVGIVSNNQFANKGIIVTEVREK